MYAVKISKNVDIDYFNLPNRLIASNHHARELITPQIALRTIERLAIDYSTNDVIKKIVYENQIYIIYTMNPDGLNRVWTGNNMWRKNLYRGFGVDLNRNYDAGWNLSCGGSTITSSETYRGPSASSEPEVQTMIAFNQERNFASTLDFHSYSRDVRINYGSCARLPTPITAMFRTYALRIASRMNYKQIQSCCTGGQIAYSYMKGGALSQLSETGLSFQPNERDMRIEVERVWPGIIEYLQFKIPIHGYVTDIVDGKPLRAFIEVKNFVWTNNESRFSNQIRNGLYHIWLPDGNHTLVFNAGGYQPETRQIILKESLKLDIILKRNVKHY